MLQCGKCHYSFKKQSDLDRHLVTCHISTVSECNELILNEWDQNTDLCRSQPSIYRQIECAKEFETIIPGLFPMVFVNRQASKYPVYQSFDEVGSVNDYDQLREAISSSPSGVLLLPKRISIP